MHAREMAIKPGLITKNKESPGKGAAPAGQTRHIANAGSRERTGRSGVETLARTKKASTQTTRAKSTEFAPPPFTAVNSQGIFFSRCTLGFPKMYCWMHKFLFGVF